MKYVLTIIVVLGAVFGLAIYLNSPPKKPLGIQWVGTIANNQIGLGLRSDGVMVWTNVIWQGQTNEAIASKGTNSK